MRRRGDATCKHTAARGIMKRNGGVGWPLYVSHPRVRQVDRPEAATGAINLWPLLFVLHSCVVVFSGRLFSDLLETLWAVVDISSPYKAESMQTRKTQEVTSYLLF